MPFNALVPQQNPLATALAGNGTPPIVPQQGNQPLPVVSPQRSQLAQALLQQGFNTQNQTIETPLEALGGAAQILSGQFIQSQQADAQQARDAATNEALGKILAGQGIELPEGVDIGSLPPQVTSAILASALSPDATLSQSEVATFDTPDGPRTMPISQGVVAGFNIIPDVEPTTTARAVPGSELGFTGADADAMFEVKVDENGNVIDLGRLSNQAASTNVTVDIPNFGQNDDLVSQLNKRDADMIGDLSAEAANAESTIRTIENIRSINLETGSLTSAAGEVAGVMRAFGLGDLADQFLGVDPGDVQAYQAFVNDLVLDQKSRLGGGVISDSDILLLKSLAANPNNQPIANEIILKAFEREAQLTLAKNEAINQWLSAGNTTLRQSNGALEDSEGKTFDQWFRPQQEALQAEFRSQSIAGQAPQTQPQVNPLDTPGISDSPANMTDEQLLQQLGLQ